MNVPARIARPATAFHAFADEPGAMVLEDGAGRGVIFARPAARFIGGAEAFAAARAAREAETGPAWLAGVLGAELAGAFDRAARPPADPLGAHWPETALGLYRAAAVFHARSGRPRIIGTPPAADALRAALDAGAAPPPLEPAPAATPVAPDQDRATVEARIARAIAYVHAGDVFQVNLSQGFRGRLAVGDDPVAAWRRLRAVSPAPFAGFMRLDTDRAAATHSPERFIAAGADGRVETRPIKGTRPRGGDPGRDRALAQALRASAKDRAENLMIVDLMRNDLSRVCTPGSVAVPSLHALESYANVHHLVSTVSGRLAPDQTVFDLIAATFPPGSVTGAPKVRALEIIAELEGAPRGPYCGAMGWIGSDGACDLNVMIRTLAFHRDAHGWTAVFRAGGGVVADSAPAAEFQETLDKAASVFAALGAAVPA